MPVVKVIRPEIRPSVRRVPTATCATLMPMTLETVGQEAASDNEEPVYIQSVQEAFDKFEPKLDFRGAAGKEQTEFRAEFHFRSTKDFDPKNLLKKQRKETKTGDEKVEYLRNDIADLQSNIDLLYRLKDRWNLPAVRRAWSTPEQRTRMIEAFGRLRTEIEQVAKGGTR